MSSDTDKQGEEKDAVALIPQGYDFGWWDALSGDAFALHHSQITGPNKHRAKKSSVRDCISDALPQEVPVSQGGLVEVIDKLADQNGLAIYRTKPFSRQRPFDPRVIVVGIRNERSEYAEIRKEEHLRIAGFLEGLARMLPEPAGFFSYEADGVFSHLGKDPTGNLFPVINGRDGKRKKVTEGEGGFNAETCSRIVQSGHRLGYNLDQGLNIPLKRTSLVLRYLAQMYRSTNIVVDKEDEALHDGIGDAFKAAHEFYKVLVRKSQQYVTASYNEFVHGEPINRATIANLYPTTADDVPVYFAHMETQVQRIVEKGKGKLNDDYRSATMNVLRNIKERLLAHQGFLSSSSAADEVLEFHDSQDFPGYSEKSVIVQTGLFRELIAPCEIQEWAKREKKDFVALVPKHYSSRYSIETTIRNL